MIPPGTRILIADDQQDVARAVLRPLAKTPATLDWVENGDQAIEQLDRSGLVYDLAILDMKMPPGQWGGLAVLEWIASSGNRTPVLVLSGEGGQKQTIQAMRMGAVDWLSKDEAASICVESVSRVIQRLQDQALGEPDPGIPLPAARAIDHWRRGSQGADSIGGSVTLLHAVETIWRLAAFVGLSALPQDTPVKGIALGQMAKPSMGVALDLCLRVRAALPPDSPVAPFLQCIADDRPHDLVTARNAGIGHPSSEPGLRPEDHLKARQHLLTFLRRFRNCDPGVLTVAGSMSMRGGSFQVEMHPVTLAHSPSRTLECATPLGTGEAYWLRNGVAVPLRPWLMMGETDQDPNRDVLVFDGVRTKSRDLSDDAAPFWYSSLRGKTNHAMGGTLADLRAHFN